MQTTIKTTTLKANNQIINQQPNQSNKTQEQNNTIKQTIKTNNKHI